MISFHFCRVNISFMLDDSSWKNRAISCNHAIGNIVNAIELGQHGHRSAIHKGVPRCVELPQALHEIDRPELAALLRQTP